MILTICHWAADTPEQCTASRVGGPFTHQASVLRTDWSGTNRVCQLSDHIKLSSVLVLTYCSHSRRNMSDGTSVDRKSTDSESSRSHRCRSQRASVKTKRTKRRLRRFVRTIRLRSAKQRRSISCHGLVAEVEGLSCMQSSVLGVRQRP